MPKQNLHWTAEQYSHTLIAKPPQTRPSAAQIQAFLSTMIAQKVVPGKSSISLWVPTGEMREYPNPFTGQNFKVEMKEQRTLDSVDEVAKSVGGLQDYDLGVTGVGRPKIAPLPLDFKKPYHISVICRVCSQPRSTSNLHETPSGNQKAISYGQPCTEVSDCGYFSNPYTMEVISIPGAGCACFWIQFELGKFLFPEFSGDRLELLNPLIVAEAESVFKVEFVQGCYWG